MKLAGTKSPAVTAIPTYFATARNDCSGIHGDFGGRALCFLVVVSASVVCVPAQNTTQVARQEQGVRWYEVI